MGICCSAHNNPDLWQNGYQEGELDTNIDPIELARLYPDRW